MKQFIMLVSLIGIFACTDAQMSSIYALGNGHHVQCYSGGVIIYDGYTTGAISWSKNSDVYYFREKKTNLLRMVSGNCIITTLS